MPNERRIFDDKLWPIADINTTRIFCASRLKWFIAFGCKAVRIGAHMSADTNFNKFTYEDYVLFLADGKRHEIIEGDHYVNPPPNSYHQAVLSRINSQFIELVEKPKLGFVFFAPIDVQLDELNIVQPDLVVILNERKSIITKKNIQGAPSLAVEIISPGNPKHDRQLKKKLYEKCEIPEYWIVDPESETIEAYLLVDKRYVLQSNSSNEVQISILPDAKVNTKDLWRFEF